MQNSDLQHKEFFRYAPKSKEKMVILDKSIYSMLYVQLFRVFTMVLVASVVPSLAGCSSKPTVSCTTVEKGSGSSKTHLDPGTKIIFRIYGGVCGVVALLFTAINFYSLKEGKFTSDLGEEIDPRNVRRAGY